MKEIFIIKKEHSYIEVIKVLLKKKNKVIFLEGEMGVGKTTFIIEFLKYFNKGRVEFSSLGVMSPTYSIINEYRLGKDRVLHADFYRIDEEFFEWEDFIEEIDESRFVFIEWGEKVPKVIENINIYSRVHITQTKAEERKIALF